MAERQPRQGRDRRAAEPGRGGGTPPARSSSGKGQRSDRQPSGRTTASSREASGRAKDRFRGDRPPGSVGGSRSGVGRRSAPDQPRSQSRSGAPGRRDQRSSRGNAPVAAAKGGPPEIPDGVTGQELDRFVLRALSGLPSRVAGQVAAHLVMAGRLVDEDPERAYQHARAARGLAGRVAVVREAVGETAYASGRYQEALAELRAGRRINGSADYLPIMADCERALRRPLRALELAKDPQVAGLDPAGQAEITIVAAGARRDLGQLEAALQLLETAPLASRARQPWVARLRYAYADALAAAGRGPDAVTWFHRTVAVDGQRATDAEERLAELEQAELR